MNQNCVEMRINSSSQMSPYTSLSARLSLYDVTSKNELVRMNDYWSHNQKILKKVGPLLKKLRVPEINLIDGGGAGELPNPFRSLAELDLIRAVRFEPRGAVEVKNGTTDVVIPSALWSKKTELPLFLTRGADSSSTLRPNKYLLDTFLKEHASVRDVIDQLSIPANSLDNLVMQGSINSPDFIKLDVHGSELKTLEGSKSSLDTCVGLLVEGWHAEVHEGQGLMFSVDRLLHEAGFDIYDSVCAARWRHKPHSNSSSNTDRARFVGSETLYIRRHCKPDLLEKKILTLVIFGFTSPAFDCADSLPPDRKAAWIEIIRKYRSLASRSPSFRFRQLSSVLNSKINHV